MNTPENTSQTHASARQVAANRRNAERSTGPRTPEGKATVARNAVKHGLCAKAAVIPGEDPAEFAAMRAQFLNELKPADAVDRVLVERVALAAWRLGRAARYESSLVRNSLAHVEQSLRTRRRVLGEDEVSDEESDIETLRARAVAVCLAGPAFQTLMRYEGAIERGMFRALKELRDMWGNHLNFKTLARRPCTWDPTAVFDEEAEPDTEPGQGDAQVATVEDEPTEQSHPAREAHPTKQSQFAEPAPQVPVEKGVTKDFVDGEYVGPNRGAVWADLPEEDGEYRLP